MWGRKGGTACPLPGEQKAKGVFGITFDPSSPPAPAGAAMGAAGSLSGFTYLQDVHEVSVFWLEGLTMISLISAVCHPHPGQTGLRGSAPLPPPMLAQYVKARQQWFYFKVEQRCLLFFLDMRHSDLPQACPCSDGLVVRV